MENPDCSKCRYGRHLANHCSVAMDKLQDARAALDREGTKTRIIIEKCDAFRKATENEHI